MCPGRRAHASSSDTDEHPRRDPQHPPRAALRRRGSHRAPSPGRGRRPASVLRLDRPRPRRRGAGHRGQPTSRGGDLEAPRMPARTSAMPASWRRAEGLAGEQRAEQDAGDGVQQADEADRPGVEVAQAGEPARERERGGDQRDVGEPERRGGIDGGGAPSNTTAATASSSAAGDQLPRGQREDVDVAAPALGEQVAGATRASSPRPRRATPERVDRAGAAAEHQGDAGDPDARRRPRRTRAGAR